jgi:hypothetical protein
MGASMEMLRLYVESPNEKVYRDIIAVRATGRTLPGSPAIAFPLEHDLPDAILGGICVAGAPNWSIHTTNTDGVYTFALHDRFNVSHPIGYGCFHHAIHFESWAEYHRAVRNFDSAFRQSAIHTLAANPLQSNRMRLLDDGTRASMLLHEQAIQSAINTLTDDRPQDERFYVALTILKDAEARFEQIRPFCIAAAA